jgi:hypothetical protein
LPVGFLAIDLAHELGLPLFDPDSQIDGADGKKIFEPVEPSIAQQTPTVRQHPVSGNGLLGGAGLILKNTDAKVVVVANGGSDLIYLPARDPALLKKIVAILTQQDYVGGIFVNDEYKNVPGALPTSSIGLIGSSLTPSPTIAVTFKTFSTDSLDPVMTGVQITDYPLQHGQGMHGSFGRANTFNFMAATGPDFKTGFVDDAPISNADIAPTLARILGFTMASNGKLKGRVLTEALAGQKKINSPTKRTVTSFPAANGKVTVLNFQELGQQRYFDEACFRQRLDGQSRSACPD